MTYKTFKDLTQEEQIELVVARYVHNKSIELFFDAENTWKLIHNPTFYRTAKYRLAQTSDTIDWTQIEERWQFMKRDRSGSVYLYTERPDKLEEYWGVTGECAFINITNIFTSYKRGTVPWDKSLVKRS